MAKKIDSLRRGGFLIAKIHQLSGRVFARKLKEEGVHEINPSQGRILFALWEQDNIPITELSHRTQLEKSTLTSMLNRLEREGFVERVRSTDDKRKICIRRTKKDKAFQKSYLEITDSMAKLIYQGRSADEVNQFEEFLTKVLENLEEYEELR